MGVNRVASPIDVAVSGMRAESLRMNVTANNIANVNTARTDAGTPYRRKSVVLSTESGGLSGVSIERVADDMSSNFKEMLSPGDPNADENGYVQMPNIELPAEMMEMVTASRGYQANAAVLKRYQDMIDVAVDAIKT